MAQNLNQSRLLWQSPREMTSEWAFKWLWQDLRAELLVTFAREKWTPRSFPYPPLWKFVIAFCEQAWKIQSQGIKKASPQTADWQNCNSFMQSPMNCRENSNSNSHPNKLSRKASGSEIRRELPREFLQNRALYATTLTRAWQNRRISQKKAGAKMIDIKINPTISPSRVDL